MIKKYKEYKYIYMCDVDTLEENIIYLFDFLRVLETLCFTSSEFVDSSELLSSIDACKRGNYF